MNTLRIMVTGGAGFLGSHLCDALLAEGHAVTAVDNLLTGRRGNIEHLRNDSRFEFLEHDICQPFDCGRVDYVFNFASPASPVDYSEHGIETLQVGSLGTFNALELARKYEARFLMASTSECYGDPEEHPQKETYWGHVNPIGPRSVYDEAKRFSEAATVAYRRYHQLDAKLARIFNTYGPRMQINDGRVVPNFMKQALRGEDLTVYGDGKQSRSFTFVGDVVKAMAMLMAAAPAEGEVFNVAGHEEITIGELAQLVIDRTHSSSKVKFVPFEEVYGEGFEEMTRRAADTAKLERTIGYRCDTSLVEALDLMIEFARDSVPR